jgi:hypothetical protein
LILIGAGIFVALMIASVVVRSVLPALQEKKLAQELLARGKVVSATVIQASDTGGRMGVSPRIDVELEVSPADGPAYRARKELWVLSLQAPLFQPGARLSLRVDPLAPQRFMIQSVNGIELGPVPGP